MFDIVTFGSATVDIFVESDEAHVVNIRGVEREIDLYCLKYGEKIEIVYIGVLKEFQNKKVASSLVEELLKISENSKCENITLEVNVDNKNAIKLYQK